MKYTLIMEHEDGSKLTSEFGSEGLDGMLANILYFLRGASFVIDAHATLEIVEPLQLNPPMEALSKRKKK